MPCVTFRNMFFYGENLLAPLPTPNLEDQKKNTKNTYTKRVWQRNSSTGQLDDKNRVENYFKVISSPLVANW